MVKALEVIQILNQSFVANKIEFQRRIGRVLRSFLLDVRRDFDFMSSIHRGAD